MRTAGEHSAHSYSTRSDTARTRRAAARLNSFDPETGTFTAVAATETPVQRSDYFDGKFREVLSLRPGAARLERLQSGRAPILNSHRAGSAQDQIGIVTGALIENGQLIVNGKLSPRADVKPIAEDMAAGILRNVSIGYRVNANAETKDQNGIRTITRTDWEPLEVSIVPIAADPQAHIRSTKGNTMPRENTAEATEDDLDREIGSTMEANDAPAGAQPKMRMSDRHARQAFELAARNGLPAEFARQHIDDGTTLEEFRALVLNKRAEESARNRVSSHTRDFDNGETLDNPEFLGRTIESALYSRMTGKAPEGAARELMGRSMLEMGAMLLQARGERVSWANRNQLVAQIMTREGGAAHSTSDFPVLLTQSGNRVLMDAYLAAQSPLKQIARRRDAVDFRTISAVRLSEAPRLAEVKEGGDVTYGSRSESKEAYRMKTFAKIFSITRQAIINDDLGAFADSTSAWGQAAAQTEADQLVALFTANSGDGVDLDDSDPLYTTARPNKASSGGAIGLTTLDAARQSLRTRTGLDGKTIISATPKWLVVGAAKETEAQQFLAGIQATQASNVNPFAGNLSLAVEPRFSGNAWRVFADPAELPTIAISYLNGADGPILETRQGWETLGAEFRAVLDFGCGITDWRGTYLNPGN